MYYTTTVSSSSTVFNSKNTVDRGGLTEPLVTMVFTYIDIILKNNSVFGMISEESKLIIGAGSYNVKSLL